MPTSIPWCDSNRVGENTKLCLQREGNSRISEIMGHMRLQVAVNRARRASGCVQGELRVELSGRQPCPTT